MKYTVTQHTLTVDGKPFATEVAAFTKAIDAITFLDAIAAKYKSTGADVQVLVKSNSRHVCVDANNVGLDVAFQYAVEW